MQSATRVVFAVSVVVGGFSSSIFAGPLPFPGNDSRTLLRVHSTLAETPRPDVGFRTDSDRLISRGGGLVTLRSQGLGTNPPEVVAFAGLGRPADLAALGEALVSAGVGTLSSCSLDGQGGRTGPVEITWYGRTGRKNTFVIQFLDHEPPAAGLCPPEAGAVIDAIELFEERAVLNTSG
ncbi:MAG TPA: hypothetical protein VGS22_07575 [Thermoanaerobaculia bacterium]|jgi:hypothetical protein|nr:hypothetical protein [Thermoanaerobaculia bacterium]